MSIAASVRRFVQRALPLLLLLALAAAAVALARPAHSALAQPSLVSSFPADKATLDVAPAQVQLMFANRIVGGPTSFISVKNNNVEVAAGRTRVDGFQGAILYVDLRPGLPDGQYVVTWGATDFDDGSAASGAFTFTVATHPPSSTPSDGQPPRPLVVSAGDGAGSGVVQISQIDGVGYQLALSLTGVAPNAAYAVSICSMDGSCSTPDATAVVTSSASGVIVFTLFVPYTKDFAGLLLTNLADRFDIYTIAYTPNCC